MSRRTQDHAHFSSFFRIQGSHLVSPAFPDCSTRNPNKLFRMSYNPEFFRFGLFPFRSPLLWKSFFTFFSSRYLDVSVPWVSLLTAITTVDLHL